MQKISIALALAVPTALTFAAASRAEGPTAPPPAPPASAAPPPATTAAAAAAPTAAATPEPAAADPAAAPPADSGAAAEAAAPAAAEEEAPPPPPKINGYVEAAYHRVIGKGAQRDGLPMHVYDSGNSFMLHAAHLAISHSFSDSVSAVIEFDGGHDARVNNGACLYGSACTNNGVGLFDVQEAYATYKKSGFSFTAGKFVTYAGIEVIEGPMNPTVTRGYLFGYAEAFTHVGAKLHYTTDMVDIGVGAVNGWDQFVDNNDAKTILWKAAVTPTKTFFASFSGSWGAERADSDKDARLSFDLTSGITPIDELTLYVQGNYGTEKNGASDVTDPANPVPFNAKATWYGFGLQPLLKIDAMSLGARVEYFRDKGGARTGFDASYISVSVAPGYTFDGAFTLRAEYRMDQADQKILRDEKLLQTVAVSAHYIF